MANLYKWAIESMESYPTFENHKNVVFSVYWRLTCVNGKESVFIRGNQIFDPTLSKDFVSYENLTEETVIYWVKELIGTEKIISLQANLDLQIQEKQSPSIVSLPLPWAN